MGTFLEEAVHTEVMETGTGDRIGILAFPAVNWTVLCKLVNLPDIQVS